MALQGVMRCWVYGANGKRPGHEADRCDCGPGAGGSRLERKEKVWMRCAVAAVWLVGALVLNRKISLE